MFQFLPRRLQQVGDQVAKSLADEACMRLEVLNQLPSTFQLGGEENA